MRKRTVFSIAVFTTLFGLLFQYRILSFLRRLDFNVTPFGTKFTLPFTASDFPVGALPFYYTLDYLNTVWFTTLLGLFIAGGVIVFFRHRLHLLSGGPRWAQVGAGTLLGLPNLFCSCCAVSVAAGLQRAGAAPGTLLSFFLAAPSLNVVVILLAFEMLPLKLAVARLVLGAAAVILPAIILAKQTFTGEAKPIPASPVERESAAALLGEWLKQTGLVAKTVFPFLLSGIVIVSIVKTLLPLEAIAIQLSDGLLSTVGAAALGTFIMVPTFTEVLWVSEGLKHGLGTGPAVALLTTLPAVSFPSLWALGKVTGSYRTAAILGLIIFLLGAGGGLVFSLF